MTVIVIPLPWTRPPLRSNDRRSWQAQHRTRAQASTEARWAIKAAKVRSIVGANAVLHYRPKTRRRQDADGLAPTLKVVLDALVFEGVLPDDGWIYVPQSGCRIHDPDTGEQGIWLALEVLTEFGGAA